MSAGAENCGHGAENAYMNSDKIGILDKDTDRGTIHWKFGPKCVQ